jgi:hypothetical protein
MSRSFVALSLFLAASVGFAAPARAQYNAPTNQYDLQRGPGGGYDLPAPAPPDTPQFENTLQLQDNPARLERLDQRLDRPYQIDQGCPSCRVD